EPPVPEKKRSAATTTTPMPTTVAIRSHGISGDLRRLPPCVCVRIGTCFTFSLIWLFGENTSGRGKIPGKDAGINRKQKRALLFFLYHSSKGVTQVLVRHLVFFCKQDECRRGQQVPVELFPDNLVHLGDHVRLRHTPGLHDTADQFLRRIVCLEDGRGRLEPDGDRHDSRVEKDRKDAIFLPDEPCLFCPPEQDSRLLGAHPLAVKRIIVDELVLAHPGLAGVPERCCHRDLEGQFGVPRRIFFKSRASSPSPAFSFAISMSVQVFLSVSRT